MAYEHAIDASPSPHSAESRLLLMTARQSFKPDQLSQITKLADHVSDWDFVVETSMQKFSAPYLLHALRETGTNSIPPQTLQRLSDFTKFTNMRVLKIAAAQSAFHRTCIEPLNAKHAYAKGIALSLQFDASFAKRFCRDIDVLVENKKITEIVSIAVENNYRVVLSTSPLKFAETPSDIKFMAKFPSDVGLISPDGILIEVHRRLDKKDFIFDVNDALETAEPVKWSGLSMNTLRPDLHFTYICYHHSRHLWSHLHWLADLDLMLRSDKLDHSQIQQTAKQVGLTPTTDASVALHGLLSRPDEWLESPAEQGLEGEFLNACLSNLSGGMELEYELRQHSFGHDLMSKAQISPEHLEATRDTIWRNKFRPILEQYLKRPLPHALFWMYRVQRALVVFRDSVYSSVFGETNSMDRSPSKSKDP